MHEEEEIPQLRALYDELWNDAKTMIRDMREGISMYRFSAFLILVFSFVSAWAALGGSFAILAGSTDFIDYFNAFFGVFATVLFVLFGLRLVRWYYKLKERYAKLLQIEKTIED